MINVRLPAATKDAAKAAAEKDSRSLSAWIALTLRLRLAELGYLDGDGQPVRRAKKGG
jgi:predicted HicB family RNase H-like nuclease